MVARSRSTASTGDMNVGFEFGALLSVVLGCAFIGIVGWGASVIPGGRLTTSSASARRCLDRSAGAGGDQAAARLRPVGRASQQGRRNRDRREEVQGRDRLCRLSIQPRTARGADHRADDHPGKYQTSCSGHSAPVPPMPPARCRKSTRVPTIAAAASSSQVYDQGYRYLFGTFTPNDTLTTPLTDIIKSKAPGGQEDRHSGAQRTCSRWRSPRRWRSRPGRTASRWSISRNTPSTPSIFGHSVAMKSLNPQWILHHRLHQ